MPVVTFAVDGRENCVVGETGSFMYARTEHGSFVLPVRCPHRGGPLNLAAFEPGRTRLLCPWHGRATSVTKAINAGIPAVRRGNSVTAVFAGTAPGAYTLEHRPRSKPLSVR
jgi:nitrite reductase (NADH) small subunit